MTEREITTIFAQNLTYHLDINGKNQTDLAAYMKVSQATVSNWCKGHKLPRMDKVDKLCEYFGISRAALMHDRYDTRTPYYMTEEMAKVALFMLENPEYNILFETIQKVEKSDIELVNALLNRIAK